jgi:hypothetical protein
MADATKFFNNLKKKKKNCRIKTCFESEEMEIIEYLLTFAVAVS